VILRAEPAGDEVYLLGEGPVWDDVRNRLLWVDIDAGDVLTGELSGTQVTVTRRTHVDRTVGAVLPTADGHLLVPGRTVVHLLDDAGVRQVCRVLPENGGRRLNDAACDPAGRLVVGTLSLGADPYRREQSLHRLEDDGSLTTLDDDLTLSNGIAWSPDGRVLYSVDTLAGWIRARTYDPETGAVGPRQDLLRIEPGWPDGLRVDADGHLWVAVWGAGEVRCHRPDGTLAHVVEVPAPHTSALAFAGPELGTLVITTATSELSADQSASHPASGRLHAVDVRAALGVHGLPTTPWNAAPLHVVAPPDHAAPPTDPPSSPMET
jgi:sugar lactone lactonase YvrE